MREKTELNIGHPQLVSENWLVSEKASQKMTAKGSGGYPTYDYTSIFP